MNFTEITYIDSDKIKKLSRLATQIIKKHYDPILGEEQNDYMIEKFQTTEAITHQLDKGYHYYLVSDHDGNELGFIAYIPRKHDMYLSKFYLLESERGKGISKDMLQFVMRKTEELELASIVLNVNKYNRIAIRAYEKLGFIKIGEEKNDIGNGYYMDDFVYKLII